ncbi:MAG: ComEC/Rec2 family competence protein [Alphaproteobacteria bacterium]
MPSSEARAQRSEIEPAAGDGPDFGEPRVPLLRLARAIFRWRDAIAAVFEREVELGRAVLWLPVLFGAGILIYFALPSEPSLGSVLGATVAAGGATFAFRGRVGWFRFWLAIAVLSGGVTVMKARTEIVSAPILAEAYVGDLTGWVEGLERFGPNERRLVVRVVSLEDIPSEETPFRVRISVRGQFDAVAVGVAVQGLVSLRPPAAPVMPGGYDFGRELFYRQIGASGFSYGPPELIDLGQPPFGIRWKIPIAEFRAGVGDAVEMALPHETGQIANALITGDRGGISDETTEALRQSGLGHILAISGLHMALVAGGIFGFLRALFALSPTFALRYPIKKWAAVGAIVAAAGYLILSGTGIATQRSFIMLCVMLFAVLLDRRAFSVRNVAIAAFIVLIVKPEALLTASFQMSFAATLALITGFEVVSERRRKRNAIGPAAERTFGRSAMFWVGGLLLTSVLAGLATAPFAAFHFNRTAPLSLLANLAAVPAVSLIVMPAALVAVLVMPLGLEGAPLWLVDLGLSYIIGIAEMVANWTGDAGLVASAPVGALLAVAIGLVWLCLWRTRWRLVGIPMILIGISAAALGPRPDLLIEESGEVVAVRAADGTYRVIGSGSTYEVETWLRADADPRARNDDALQEGVACDHLGCTALIGNTPLRVAVALDYAAFADDCRLAAIIVTSLVAPEDCGLLVIDRDDLARGAAHAVYLERHKGAEIDFRVAAARPETRRPWMPPLPSQ